MSHPLANVFAAIAQEASESPCFRQRLIDALQLDAGLSELGTADPRKGAALKPKNRRQKAILDPYVEIGAGESRLRERLSLLNVEELKDVVSEHALDSTRLALKWKSAERLIDLIVATVRGRLDKGDAFRAHPSQDSSA